MLRSTSTKELLVGKLIESAIELLLADLPSAEKLAELAQESVTAHTENLNKWQIKRANNSDPDFEPYIVANILEAEASLAEVNAQDFEQMAAIRKFEFAQKWAESAYSKLNLEEVALPAPANKPGGGKRRFVIKDDRVQDTENGREIVGFTTTSDSIGQKVAIAPWALDDNHPMRNNGTWLIGHWVDEGIVVEGQIKDLTSPSHLIAKASEVWGITSAGVNQTPFQTGTSVAGEFLTKEQIQAVKVF